MESVAIVQRQRRPTNVDQAWENHAIDHDYYAQCMLQTTEQVDEAWRKSYNYTTTSPKRKLRTNLASVAKVTRASFSARISGFCNRKFIRNFLYDLLPRGG